MKRGILLSIVLSLLFVSTAAALEPGDTLWTRTYGGSDYDQAWSVQQTSDGGYIVAGMTESFGAGMHDVYLVKTDGNGDTLWTRTYGGSDDDIGTCVQQTTDGGYIIAGSTDSFGAGLYDVYLVKTDASGDTMWTRTYGGSDLDDGRSVRQTADRGYIVAGVTMSFGAGMIDLYLVKTDENGHTLWTRTYGGSEIEDGSESVQQTTDGGYVLVGWTLSFGAGDFDLYLVKTDSVGNPLWTRTYGGSLMDCGYCVQQTSDDGYIVAGHTMSFGAGDFDVYLVKTDSVGDTLWTRTYGGSLMDAGPSVQQTSDGGYIIGGQTMSFGAGNFDVWLLKTDATADTLWTRTYGGSDSDAGRCVQQTTDGGYIVAGATMSFGVGGFDFYLVRVAGEELPALSIEIIPDDPPVTVPQGGSFGFTGTLTNNTEELQVTDAWTMAIGPEKGIYGPFKVRYDLSLGPYEVRSAHFNQQVPNLAPLGFYNYIAYCGDYPSTVMDSSFFQVEVIAGPSGGATSWVLTGSFLEGDLVDLPKEYALLGNYPNPFNASTVISYQLPTEAHVKLEVYNLLGQKMATLVESKQQAGCRAVAWDASAASSGLYLYKLTAGDFAETKRMMLIK